MDQESNISKAERIKGWQAQLDQLRFANNKLRDCLAKAISREVSTALLEEAEHFNQKFIDMDQIIELMRHEINGLSHYGGEAMTEQEGILLLQFKKDMERCENEFYNLGRSFTATFQALRIEK